MVILYHCTFSNNKEWEIKIKQKFKNVKLITIKDKKFFNKVEFAIVWNLPKSILSCLPNLKAIFSLGAGVDHILQLKDYSNTPIIRIKDPKMGTLMSYYVMSQILNFQLGNNFYRLAQIKKEWIKEIVPTFNSNLTIGILGVGYLGSYIAKFLKKINYRIIGYKKNKGKKFNFPIYYDSDLSKFIKSSDVIVIILPSTKETRNFINSSFLNKMKKKSLLINVGRGSCVNEKDLIKHLLKNKKCFASLDVFKSEPLPKKNLFWKIKNLNITPHVASITDVDSAVEYIYKKYNNFKYNKKIISNVDLKKGY